MVGFELLKAFYASANEELVPCDISSDESVQQALTHIRHFYGNTIHAVIHLAAYYSFPIPTQTCIKKSPSKGPEVIAGFEKLSGGAIYIFLAPCWFMPHAFQGKRSMKIGRLLPSGDILNRRSKPRNYPRRKGKDRHGDSQNFRRLR